MISTFDQLDTQEIYSILAIRQRIFVVEQNCFYLDADGLDQSALHLRGVNAQGQLCAYLRMYRSHKAHISQSSETEKSSETGDLNELLGDQVWHIGRVLVIPELRGEGVGRALMKEAINSLNSRGAQVCELNAQAYLKNFYERLDFKVTGPLFDDAGIPHLPMRREEQREERCEERREVLDQTNINTNINTKTTNDQIRHIIFDLDGTLIDSAHDYALCFQKLAQDLSRPKPSIESVKSLMFAGLVRQLDECIGPRGVALHQRTLERFRVLCLTQSLNHTQSYPQVRTLLRDLKREGYILSVCTNRPQDLCEQVLTHLGMRDDFYRVVGGDRGLERKPNPEMLQYLLRELNIHSHQAIFIGDSVVDIQAADAVNIPVIAAMWGYTPPNILREAGPMLCLDQPKELFSYLSRCL